MSDPIESSRSMEEKAGHSPRAVWVLADTSAGHIQKVTFELLGDAKKLSSMRRTRAEVLVLCGEDQSARMLEELRPCEPVAIHLLTNPLLEQYTTDGYLQALAPLIRSEDPSLLLLPATANGRDLAPRLAARCGMGFVPHALTLKPSGSEKLEITRVTHGGGVHTQAVWTSARPLLVTMRPGVADAPPANAAASDAPVIRHTVTIDETEIRVRVLEQIPADPRVQDIREAERIVSGGKGVGSPEGFAVVRDLADALHASVGASRVVVDLGWAPYERQVGQTGKTVAPQLYVAVGISGASHHLMGMRGSEKIVAVNCDRKAPIFSVAHFGVVGDLHAVLPALTRRIKAARGEISARSGAVEESDV